MPAFGKRWVNPRALRKGGQAVTYTVDDAENPGGPICVAKILNNPREDRKARFLQEIEVSESFDNPNVVRSIGRGETLNSKTPFFVMPYYDGGTLAEHQQELGSPLDRLKIFYQICQGVAYAHGKGLIHRDLKPANIFLAAKGVPVVGDFGLCYRYELDDQERVTLDSELVGARKYMPPEWREGRVDNPQQSGNIYSLGKILYWTFAGREYDGHEDDHCIKGRTLVETRWMPLEDRGNLYRVRINDEKWTLAYSLVDTLARQTLQKRVELRLQYSAELADAVWQAIYRVEADGRALDLRLPKRCVFCGQGTYKPSHEVQPGNHKPRDLSPELQERENPSGSSVSPSFRDLHDHVSFQFGMARQGIPLVLICDYCGNIQQFRLDLTADKFGRHWLP